MRKFNITVNGNSYEVEVEEVGATTSTAAPIAPPAQVTRPVPQPAAAAPIAPKPVAPAPAASGSVGDTKITSPMPGNIIKINVTAGQAITKGTILCILEAMKMENEIMAPADGTVASINTQQGASVNTGDLLLTLK